MKHITAFEVLYKMRYIQKDYLISCKTPCSLSRSGLKLCGSWVGLAGLAGLAVTAMSKLNQSCIKLELGCFHFLGGLHFFVAFNF